MKPRIESNAFGVTGNYAAQFSGMSTSTTNPKAYADYLTYNFDPPPGVVGQTYKWSVDWSYDTDNDLQSKPACFLWGGVSNVDKPFRLFEAYTSGSRNGTRHMVWPDRMESTPPFQPGTCGKLYGYYNFLTDKEYSTGITILQIDVVCNQTVANSIRVDNAVLELVSCGCA